MLPWLLSSAAARLHLRLTAFLLCPYILLGAASSCIFLTQSLRLLPFPCGLLLLPPPTRSLLQLGAPCLLVRPPRPYSALLGPRLLLHRRHRTTRPSSAVPGRRRLHSLRALLPLRLLALWAQPLPILARPPGLL
jgi:hypothetical protein